ncbi:unnamed protein product [Didymodactylos carnosus]|uniref:Uncharacterized protein n=1 Tax=Didymodactylos carnosus TaxID=1234261 RepID=A0A815PAF3_9BILA|nr:unnamed protein product [Didymodactylos carnosus]CAF1446338.1 unnamed protein product [Didymodactylos carnosus]CAF4178417.1 unnamed protein product [Didymodactylos carnosus]CAF4320887.1 unnamed protein product [Didymodactylos carnosus]
MFNNEYSKKLKDEIHNVKYDEVGQDELLIKPTKLRTYGIGTCIALIFFLKIQDIDYVALYHNSLAEIKSLDFVELIQFKFNQFFRHTKPDNYCIEDIKIKAVIIIGAAYHEDSYNTFIESFKVFRNAHQKNVTYPNHIITQLAMLPRKTILICAPMNITEGNYDTTHTYWSSVSLLADPKTNTVEFTCDLAKSEVFL